MVKARSTVAETGAAIDAVLPEFVRPREAAAILRLSDKTLVRLRASGEGPACFMFGDRFVYALADLATWAAARRYRNTAETGEF